MAASAVDSMVAYGRRFAFGSGLGYGFYPYDYYDGYGTATIPMPITTMAAATVVQQRVHTSHGWRTQPVQVCG